MSRIKFNFATDPGLLLPISPAMIQSHYHQYESGSSLFNQYPDIAQIFHGEIAPRLLMDQALIREFVFSGKEPVP